MKLPKTPKSGKNQSKIHTLYIQRTYNVCKLHYKCHHSAYSPDNFSNNKRGFSADAAPLSSALRPRLFGTLLVATFLSIILQVCFSMPTFAASITLNIPSNLSVNITPGTTAQYKKSESDNITVSTDAPFGYNLSIKVKDGINGNSLMNGNNKLASINTNMAESVYQNSGMVNTWGYIPSKFNGLDNTDVRPGPNATGDTLEKTSMPNSSNANSYSIALATKIDSTIPSGSYKNTFVISAVANSVDYSVTYNLNQGSEGPSNIPNANTVNDTITLENKTPTRSGYEFLGWCDKETDNDTCDNGQIYQPGQVYTLVNGTNNIELWAMWKQNRPIAPITMQDFGDYCNYMSENEALSLMDTRDSNEYKIAKLADGKCWMIQNLRLGDSKLTSKNSSRTLSATDTDLSSGSYDLPVSSTNGFSNNSTANVYVPDSASGNYKMEYGGYYTWIAATAGTGSSVSQSYMNASGSICPKGWRLPRGSDKNDDNNEFASLLKAYGGTGENVLDTALLNKIVSPALPGFVYSGYYRSSSATYQDVSSFWWSSTSIGNYGAYRMYLDKNGNVAPLGYNGRGDGNPVRCVSRSNDPTMQTVEEWADSIQKGQSLEGIVDIRDGNTYTVARLEDDKLWMTQNLRLGKTTEMELTPSDTDISANYTLPAITTKWGVAKDNEAKEEVVESLYVDTGNAKYGGYYTWFVATAGSGLNMPSGQAEHSICPKGWRLPTYTEANTFIQKYNSSSSVIAQPPANFTYAGFYSSDNRINVDFSGDWWTSTVHKMNVVEEGNSAYEFGIVSVGDRITTSFMLKNMGISIRCIFN